MMCLPAAVANSSAAPLRSSSSPRRCSGTPAHIASTPSRSSEPLVIFDGKKPGASALTVMLCSPHSAASVRVKLTTAPLEVL
ncbi:hypothetical protein D3C71_2059310 [compost metagenome]